MSTVRAEITAIQVMAIMETDSFVVLGDNENRCKIGGQIFSKEDSFIPVYGNNDYPEMIIRHAQNLPEFTAPVFIIQKVEKFDEFSSLGLDDLYDELPDEPKRIGIFRRIWRSILG